MKIRFPRCVDGRKCFRALPYLVSAILGMVLLLFYGNSETADAHGRSLFAWLFHQYRQDILPALFTGYGLWLLFAQKKKLAELPSKPDIRGVSGFLAMLALFAVAWRLEKPALGYVSAVGMGWFLVFIFKGAPRWRKLASPCIWFLLGTPGLLNPLTVPLRLATAESVVWMLNLLGVPANRYGTTVVSFGPAVWHFSVADECSGTRTITTMLFVAMLISSGAFRGTPRVIFVLSALPVGLAMNILRTLTIGLMCQWRGEEAGIRFHHTLLAGAGPLVVGTALLVVLGIYLRKQRPDKEESSKPKPPDRR